MALMKMKKWLTSALMLSLEEMALRKVVATLWIELPINWCFACKNKDDLLDFPEEDTQTTEWQEAIEMVKSEISKLLIPESLKQSMMLVIKPIGKDILEWKKFHEKRLYDSCRDFDKCILKHLCWTSLGSVDYQETAKELVCMDMLSIVKRYKLACLYCLVDFIPVLWTELSDQHKSGFSGKSGISFLENMELEYYWPYILEGQELKLEHMYNKNSSMPSFHLHAFHVSACRGNKAATEYFFQKLTHKERASYILTTVSEVPIWRRGGNIIESRFPAEKNSDVLYYLLSMMSAKKKMRALLKFSIYILRCFLDWPWQKLFLDTADLMWAFRNEEKYDNYLIHCIAESIIDSGYYFPSLFQKFFLRSPSDFKKKFMEYSYLLFTVFFPAFFDAEDTETVKVIFRNVEAKDKVRFVFHPGFENYLEGENWSFVELCLKEAALSEEQREELHDSFMRILPRNDENKIFEIRIKLNKIFKSLDESNVSAIEKGI